MSELVHPVTGQPLSTKPAAPRQLDDASILNAFKALQLKIDGLAQQEFQAGVLLEYLIDTMNSFTLSDGSTPLAIKQEEFAVFYHKRVQEFQQEMEQMRAAVAAEMAEEAKK